MDTPFAHLAAAMDLVLPRGCAGCERPGEALCVACRSELAGLALPDGPVTPHPRPPDWPGCTGVLRYEGVAARLAREVKDGGRRDLVDPLGRLLAESLRRALPAAARGREVPLVVPVPSAPAAVRARGDQPMLLMAREATRHLAGRVRLGAALALRRGTRDQAGLGRAERITNLHGAMRVSDPATVRGRACLLVDDVLTSGATLSEGRRALLSAGAVRVDLSVVMVTPSRRPRRGTGPSLPFVGFSD